MPKKSADKTIAKKSEIVVEVGNKLKTITVDNSIYTVLNDESDGIYFVGYLNYMTDHPSLVGYKFLGQPSDIFRSRLNEIPLGKKGHVILPIGNEEYFKDCLYDEGFVIVKEWTMTTISHNNYLIARK